VVVIAAGLFEVVDEDTEDDDEDFNAPGEVPQAGVGA
jgi:hypothetical protein